MLPFLRDLYGIRHSLYKAFTRELLTFQPSQYRFSELDPGRGHPALLRKGLPDSQQMNRYHIYWMALIIVMVIEVGWIVSMLVAEAF